MSEPVARYVTVFTTLGTDTLNPVTLEATGWMEHKNWWLIFNGRELAGQHKKEHVAAIQYGKVVLKEK